MHICETNYDLMGVGEKTMLFIPEGFYGLPPNDCGDENATAAGRSCTEDTIVLTHSRQ